MLQSAEKLAPCPFSTPSRPRSVDASADQTLLQEALRSSNLPSNRKLGIHLQSSSIDVGWLAYALMRFVTGEGCRVREWRRLYRR